MKEVTLFQSDSGETFPTPEEARRADAVYSIEEFIDDNSTPIDGPDMFGWLDLIQEARRNVELRNDIKLAMEPTKMDLEMEKKRKSAVIRPRKTKRKKQ